MSVLTLSLCFDIAFLLAKRVKNSDPDLHWELYVKKKSSINYQHPVLLGFKDPPMTDFRWDPWHIVIVFANSAIQGKELDREFFVEAARYAERAI